MRNHLDILKDIEVILTENELISEKGNLEKEIRGSSTGSELCMGCGSLLLRIKSENESKKNLINLIKEFIFYCNKNGLYPQ